MASYQVNEKLPFDILGLVFAHYAEEENINHPLETLLLVCRAWNTAALSHQTLWNNLRIYFGHTSIFNVWKTRLPLRLARCGPAIPLDIDLRNGIEKPFPTIPGGSANSELFSPSTCPLNPNANEMTCGCCLAARDLAKDALRELTGNDGRLCARWRSLQLGLGYVYHRRHTEEVMSSLRYPTPILKILRLEDTLLKLPEVVFPVLPNTPLLNSIALLGCVMPSLPDMQNVLYLELGSPCFLRAYPNLSNFGNATRLRTLYLGLTGEIDLPLPPKLEDLLALHIKGDEIPTGLFSCDMPQVTELVLDWTEGNLPLRIRDFDGLRVNKLQILQLNWEFVPSQEVLEGIPHVTRSVFWLLTQARDLRQLHGTPVILNIVLRVLWVAVHLGDQAKIFPWRDLSLQGAWLVDVSAGRRVKIDRQVDKAFLENLAEDWDLRYPGLPDPTLNELFLVSSTTFELPIN